METTTWILIVGVPLIIAVAAFLIFRRRTPRQLPIYYFRCPGCKRKLKYFARQAGHKGMCSNCKEQFTFPSDVASGRPS